MKVVILTAVLAAFAASAYGGPVLSLIPVNATTPMAGGVTGWGYDISNSDHANFLVLNDSFVSGSLATGIFGNYVDYISSQFIVVGPGADTGPVGFQLGTAGVGEFDFAQFVPNPTTVPGAINIDYSLFSQDPNSASFDPNSFVASGTVTAAASASVAPEPATELLLTVGMLPFALAIWRRGRGRKR